ncbi:hypothetical protein JRO89_XS02G0135700 [Xanthoceras sorbifolium]|uniref:FHA domain-containing protein n=1 Tax=Xanthoceras sorbifolium TaxID=99658 RepID=A0ABQ8IFT0_9ROSI|nr:hypothetical protein JRO89_XS02G0135700 [Xanthoceras sorbifolium]
MIIALFFLLAGLGHNKYYIFTKGAYKVGRKGCDIIINKDKGVSRIHAEIFVDAMISLNPLQNQSSNVSSSVRIRDCSKYGTFINKNHGSKENVHEFPNKETTLKDGDLVSFGTGNATYRFCYVPLILSSTALTLSMDMEELNNIKFSTIAGACVTNNLCQECTHVLVDHHMPVNDLLDAVMAKKPLVLDSWLESLADKSICTEFPSCNFNLPRLTVEGVSIEIADIKTRENCLKGYTFLLEPTFKYKFGDRLQSLLEVGGAETLSIERFRSSSQDSQYGKHNLLVCVIPKGSADTSESFNKLSSLSRVNEVDLICAALSGHMNPSILRSLSAAASCGGCQKVLADGASNISVTPHNPTLSDRIREHYTLLFSKPVSINSQNSTKMEVTISIFSNGITKTTKITNYNNITTYHENLLEVLSGSLSYLFTQEFSLKHHINRLASAMTYFEDICIFKILIISEVIVITIAFSYFEIFDSVPRRLSQIFFSICIISKIKLKLKSFHMQEIGCHLCLNKVSSTIYIFLAYPKFDNEKKF